MPRAEAAVATRECRRALGGRCEDRLSSFALRCGQRHAGAARERGREHGAHRVREPGSVLLGDPRRERELMWAEQRERMHERIDRAQRSFERCIERDDNARDGARPEADTNEVTWCQLETVRNGIAEGAGRSADAREHRDLRGAGHKS